MTIFVKFMILDSLDNKGSIIFEVWGRAAVERPVHRRAIVLWARGVRTGGLWCWRDNENDRRTSEGAA